MYTAFNFNRLHSMHVAPADFNKLSHFESIIFYAYFFVESQHDLVGSEFVQPTNGQCKQSAIISLQIKPSCLRFCPNMVGTAV